MHDGLRCMMHEQEDLFYYIPLMNENYPHPGLKEGDEEGILKGMYRFKSLDKGEHRVQLLGSGTILREVIGAQQILADEWDRSEERRVGKECRARGWT